MTGSFARGTSAQLDRFAPSRPSAPRICQARSRVDGGEPPIRRQPSVGRKVCTKPFPRGVPKGHRLHRKKSPARMPFRAADLSGSAAGGRRRAAYSPPTFGWQKGLCQTFPTRCPEGPPLSPQEKPCAFAQGFSCGGSGWIRTTEGIASRFTVCPLWPLGNAPIFKMISAAMPPPNITGAGERSRTINLLITNQLLCH